VTLRRNTTDWENLRLRQKVLRDAPKVDCSVQLFGEPLAAAHPRARRHGRHDRAARSEVQAKRAADKAGIPFCLSTVGICRRKKSARFRTSPSGSSSTCSRIAAS
jgi:L-lactate dehydrogenase (cytochrome)